MNWTKQAIEVIKKFASGVDCPWNRNEDTIKQTMFHSHCKEIAKKMRKIEIDEEVAKEYILKHHNSIVANNCRELSIPDSKKIDKVIDCMVIPKKFGDNWICIHGNAELFSITQKEAEFLEKEIQRLLKGLQ